MNVHVAPQPSAPFESGPAVVVSNLVRSYGSRVVIEKLNLRIDRGEFVALLGESGCGKTTLLRALAGLDPIQGGRIVAPRRPAVVFQEHRLLPWDNLWRNVALGLQVPDPRERAAEALSEVGLGDRLDDWPRNLSGGQAQRVALARALVQQPELLLLDEPFAALDPVTRDALGKTVRRLHDARGLTTILVTHDMAEALLLADRVIVLARGRIVADAAPPELAAGRAGLKAEALVAVPREQAARLAALGR